jgi:uncharacterized protein YdcH (DUF465 family)
MVINLKKIFGSRVVMTVLVIACLILGLLLGDTYRKSRSIYRKNDEINAQYQAILKSDSSINDRIKQLEGEVSIKDKKVDSLKIINNQSNENLSKSKATANRLAILVRNAKLVNDIPAFETNCDSLAAIVPILSDQIDSAKVITASLISTFEQKTALKDSIIKAKDTIIFTKAQFLDKTILSYNESVGKLSDAENKLKKEKHAKKALIIAVSALTGLLILK